LFELVVVAVVSWSWGLSEVAMARHRPYRGGDPNPKGEIRYEDDDKQEPIDLSDAAGLPDFDDLPEFEDLADFEDTADLEDPCAG